MFKKIVIRLFVTGLGLGTLGAALAVGFYSYFSTDLPEVSTLRNVTFNQPLRIYDRNGVLLSDYGNERRNPIDYDKFPKYLREAVVDIEDRRFYEHHGLDPKGIARAVWVLITTGRKSQGASTITQQVARNFFLNNKKEFVRKIKEAILSIRIEEALSKQEILALYMNKIYLGHRSYGFVAAARTYFDKSVQDLTLSEAALLAGIQQSPSRINPIASISRATERRNQVLAAMLDVGDITKAEYDKAIAEKIEVNQGSDAPHTGYVSELARQALFNKYGEDIYTSGFKVYTTVDKATEDEATLAVRNNLLAYDRRHGWRGVKIHLFNGRNPFTKEQLVKKLQKIPSYDPIYPVVVLTADAQQAKVLTADGNDRILDLNSMKWAGKYIDQNTVGPAPTKVTDILAPGDVVYITSQLEFNTDGTTYFNNTLAQIPAVNSGLVSLDVRTGAIQALVGGFSYQQSVFNRGTQAGVQVGSTIKPFVYAAALENGYTLGSIINDAPIAIKLASGEVWRPQNYGNIYIGDITLRQGLAQSRNIVAVKLARDVGLSNLGKFIQRFGFSPDDFVVTNSLALGAANFTPLEMARAYAVFDNGGFLINPYIINRIEDAQGNLVYQAKPVVACTADTVECNSIPSIYSAVGNEDLKQQKLTTFKLDDEMKAAEIAKLNSDVDLRGTKDQSEAIKNLDKVIDIIDNSDDDTNGKVEYAPRVLDGDVAWLMHSALNSNIYGGKGYKGTGAYNGTGRRAKVLGRQDIGGKTGTTNDSRAGWFVGYAGPYTTATYVAFDNNTELGNHESGGTLGLPAWIEFEQEQLKNVPFFQIPTPYNLVQTKINGLTGLLDADGFTEYFIKGTEPTETSPIFIKPEDQKPGDDDLNNNIF